MADDIDRAGDHIELQLAAQIAFARQAGKTLVPNKTCHWCEAQIKAKLLFCDLDCRDDYERDKRLRKQ
jgi:hypothetical protein